LAWIYLLWIGIIILLHKHCLGHKRSSCSTFLCMHKSLRTLFLCRTINKTTIDSIITHLHLITNCHQSHYCLVHSRM
jgi:hypothetical protein